MKAARPDLAWSDETEEDLANLNLENVLVQMASAHKWLNDNAAALHEAVLNSQEDARQTRSYVEQVLTTFQARLTDAEKNAADYATRAEAAEMKINAAVERAERAEAEKQQISDNIEKIARTVMLDKTTDTVRYLEDTNRHALEVAVANVPSDVEELRKKELKEFSDSLPQFVTAAVKSETDTITTEWTDTKKQMDQFKTNTTSDMNNKFHHNLREHIERECNSMLNDDTKMNALKKSVGDPLSLATLPATVQRVTDQLQQFTGSYRKDDGTAVNATDLATLRKEHDEDRGRIFGLRDRINDAHKVIDKAQIVVNNLQANVKTLQDAAAGFKNDSCQTAEAFQAILKGMNDDLQQLRGQVDALCQPAQSYQPTYYGGR
jgi:predicted component of type VI protein secretion system